MCEFSMQDRKKKIIFLRAKLDITFRLIYYLFAY